MVTNTNCIGSLDGTTTVPRDGVRSCQYMSHNALHKFMGIKQQREADEQQHPILHLFGCVANRSSEDSTPNRRDSAEVLEN